MNRKEFLSKLENNINLLDNNDNYLKKICVESFFDSLSPKDFVCKLSDKIENNQDFAIALYLAGFLTGIKIKTGSAELLKDILS